MSYLETANTQYLRAASLLSLRRLTTLAVTATAEHIAGACLTTAVEVSLHYTISTAFPIAICSAFDTVTTM